ncbi:MAG TPA: type II toxin-antitoxin system VapC family toxin [Alphaproteobacteria bacterium]|nr:type II toxin-antitoxin system VapC family toxin [Alphaproteobacteria bacterium]
MLVLDSTLTLAWFFRDKQNEAVRALLQRVAGKGAVVPQIWRLEVANGLQSALRLKLIEPWYRDACLADLAALDIAPDQTTFEAAFGETLRLATRFNIPVYAASYLELAQRRGLPLAALDHGLREAGAGLGLEMVEI